MGRSRRKRINEKNYRNRESIMFLLSTLQILGWIGVGYNIKADNNWGIFASVFFAFLMGLAQALLTITEGLANGNTSKPKRS